MFKKYTHLKINILLLLENILLGTWYTLHIILKNLK